MPVLTRYAGYAPFFLLPAAIGALQAAAYPFTAQGFDLAWELACLLLSLLGVALRFWTAGVTPADGDTVEAQHLLDLGGPYSLVRHPVPVANALIATGPIGFTHSWALSAALIAVLIVYLDREIARRDRLFEARFGREHAERTRRRPRFVPDVRAYRPARCGFDLRRALRREMHWVCAVFAAFFVMDWLEDIVAGRAVEIDPAWTPPLLLSAALTIAVRLYDAPAGATAEDRPTPVISGADIVLAVGLAAMTVVAWFTPHRSWRHLGFAIAPLAARMVPTRDGAHERIRRMIGARSPLPVDDIRAAMFAGYVEDVLQILRVHAPWGWRPDIRLLGAEHVDAARDCGRGVVLWIGYFTFRHVATKMALHRAGIPVSHLIHERHGFSLTRFGRRFLNPIRTTAEGRFLEETVTLSGSASHRAMRLLRRRLLDKGVVSLTARESGLRPVAVPLLEGTVEIAAGGPDLAYATNAVLLPVFTIRRSNGVYEVRIEPPLEADRALPRRDWSVAVVRGYAARLESYVAAYPGQWCGWERA